MREFFLNVFLGFYKLINRVNRVFLSLAAGCMDETSRRKRLTESWKKLAPDYFEDDILLAGLHPWELQVVEKHVPKTGKVLVVGSGGGREMLGFCELGYEVEGIDVSQKAVDFSNNYFNTHNIKAHSICSTVEDHKFDSGPYALVYFSWFVYSYVFPKRFRQDLLKRISENLSKDGCVIMLLSTKNLQNTGGFTLACAQAFSKFTGAEGTLENRDWFDSSLAVEHIFSEAEMAREADAAGMELVEWNDYKEKVAVLKIKSS